LRSFSDEQAAIQRELSLLWGPFESALPLRLEEFLINVLKSLGPVIAIGRPDEELAPLGAARVYVADEQWQQFVEAHIREAQLIVAVVGKSDGLAWEASAIARCNAQHKSILVMPPRLRARNARERWQTFRAGLGGSDAHSELPVGSGILYWANGALQASTLSFFRRDAAGYGIALRRAHAAIAGALP
jgi:hypothetical protein